MNSLILGGNGVSPSGETSIRLPDLRILIVCVISHLLNGQGQENPISRY